VRALRQALLVLLGRLPWPWGEEMLARCFVAEALLRPSRRSQAMAWAAAQPADPGRALARALCAFHGRIVARSALLGVRSAEQLADLVEVRGELHLARARGCLLLGFHLGPRDAYLALRLRGHRVAWLGGPGAGARVGGRHPASPSCRARHARLLAGSGLRGRAPLPGARDPP
jgi:hypothetical protein